MNIFKFFWKWSPAQSKGWGTSSYLPSDSHGEAGFEMKIKSRDKAKALLSILPGFLAGRGGDWWGRECDVMVCFLTLRIHPRMEETAVFEFREEWDHWLCLQGTTSNQ